MKRKAFFFSILIILFIFILYIFNCISIQKSLANKVLRLHILANSNSVFDLKNNENGIKIGKQYPNLSRTQIYDVILNQLRGDTERELYWQNQPHIYKNVYGEIYSQK